MSVSSAMPPLHAAGTAAAFTNYARRAQSIWAQRPVTERVKVIHRVRHLIAAKSQELTDAISPELVRSPEDTLVSEVLPLADACRFLENNAVDLLRNRPLGASQRPFWLSGVASEVRREPLGLVLILGPYNYPLFLPGVQILQALTAGNAVVLKPGRGARPVADVLHRFLLAAGLDEGLFTVLEESVAAGQEAIIAGVDHVILTGSAETGVSVQTALARSLTPATMELSGCDAVFVQDDADLDLVVRALRFGLQLNGGATCIAPRRVFVAQQRAPELETRLAVMARGLGSWPLPPAVAQQVRSLLEQAVLRSARILAGYVDGQQISPVIVADAAPSMQLLQSDLFAPVLSLVRVKDDEEAIAAAAACPYALGASIFGRETGARALAACIPAGVVTINDLIAPTADPRVPFGGRGRSGFGVTRGAEGLLALTAVKTVIVRQGRRRPHLDPPHPQARALFTAYINAVHAGGWRNRAAGFRDLFRALAGR